MTDLRAIAHSFPLPSLFAEKRTIGDRRYRVVCIAHDEKTPSMIVTYHREYGWRAHCFGCGWDGDAVDVVMALERCTFKEAVKRITGDEPIAPPPELHVRSRAVLICDVCLDSRIEAEEGRFKGGQTIPAANMVRWKAEWAGWRIGECAAMCDLCTGERVKRPRRKTVSGELAAVVFEIRSELLEQG